jgi:uncharacterized protein YhbP (UPF0306 family)
MVKKTSEVKRIQAQLLAVGMTQYGLLKFETRHLPGIIHKDEQIGGVIYGRYKNGGAMFVATDRRLIFLDHKPFFRITDEFTYDVLSGVSYNAQGRYAGIVVHTRLGNFSLRFVNRRCATIFVEFIENKRIEHPDTRTNSQPESITTDKPKAVIMDPNVRGFLMSHDIGTLSSVDKSGTVYGAAVHFALSNDGNIYIVTKSGTQKARNIIDHPQIALTIYDSSTMQTLQIQGEAKQESDTKKAHDTLNKIIKPHLYGKQFAWPPLTKLVAGSYEVIAITPTELKFYDYKD